MPEHEQPLERACPWREMSRKPDGLPVQSSSERCGFICSVVDHELWTGPPGVNMDISMVEAITFYSQLLQQRLTMYISRSPPFQLALN